MEKDLEFLKEFSKDKNKLYIVHDRFTFDNLFQLLLDADFDYEDALYFILGNCSLSALVFQERIYNKKYIKLSAKGALLTNKASYKPKGLFR